jgi:hypothetical protein
LCLHTVHMSTWIKYEIQQCHCFIAPPAHTSVGLLYHCLMQPSDSQYLHKSCSLSPLAL